MNDLTHTNSIAARPDGQLLAEVATGGSEDCFAEVVRRHGGMVLGVCQRLLNNVQDAEDAAQAVFLLLWKKASSLARRETVSGWLHEVARRVASNARRAQHRRAKHDRVGVISVWQAEDGQAEWDTLRPILDEELDRLPKKYRLVVILHHLEGRSLEEIADLLDVKRPTVGTWLSRGREMLRSRFVRRGISLTTASLAATLTASACSAGVPASFAATTTQAAMLFAAGKLAGGGVLTAKSSALAEGVSRALILAKLKATAAAAVVASAVIAGGTVVATRDTSELKKLEDGVAKWVDQVEFTSTYKLYRGFARTFEDGVAGRIEDKHVWATGRFSKMDDKMRFSLDFGGPPVSTIVDGREVFGPDANISFDSVGDSNFQMFYDPYKGEGGLLRVRETIFVPGSPFSLPEALDLENPLQPSITHTRSAPHGIGRLFELTTMENQDETGIRTTIENLSGERIQVVRETKEAPPKERRTFVFWTKPNPVVVTQVINEYRVGNTSEYRRRAEIVSDFVNCDGLMVPRRVLSVGMDPEKRWLVHEWMSEDLGQRPPTAEDFIIRLPANARVQGLRNLPPLVQEVRAVSVDELDKRDLISTARTTPAGIRWSDYTGAIVLGASVVLLLGVGIFAILRKRWA
jgi:RNA polymerase sigma factor (sigma-70 family)